MKRVILTRGLPASGKTTWANELLAKEPGRWKRINKDSLREMLDGGKYTSSNEADIIVTRNNLILLALSQGKHVIVDDTNLNPMHEAGIRELVKGLAVVEVKDFTDVPIEVCIERDNKRANGVGEKVIRDMYNKWLRPTPAVPIHDHSLPNAIIVDMDGTLAIMHRDPYDTAKCDTDELNQAIATIVEATYRWKGWRVIITSGRKEEFRTQTVAWLAANDIPYHHLFMRKDDDNRKDAVIKQEMYDNEIKGKYDVRFVLDDRKSVVDMWRSNGLQVFQVAEGDY